MLHKVSVNLIFPLQFENINFLMYMNTESIGENEFQSFLLYGRTPPRQIQVAEYKDVE